MPDQLATALGILVVLLVIIVWNQIAEVVPAQFITGSMNAIILIVAFILGILAYAWMDKERGI